MVENDWKKVKELFAAAIVIPESSRQKFLDESCVNREDLRDEISRLLIADESSDEFLESSPFGDSSEAFSAQPATQGFINRKIGIYQIEREIGVGGMGTVYLATRNLNDVRQKVAFKIVHQGVYSAEILRRFYIERKILAQLEHSSIARLIDVGETSEGLPFLVMEYVSGEPLDDYCRARNLSINEKLKIFKQVCAAVAYAHRRLIIHRDLKPSNILVTSDGEAKLLDFGIAKLIAPETPESGEPAKTPTLMNLLTPAYAAPEQLRGDAVTTATDIYSLGVVLYELLTESRPYNFENFSPIKIADAIYENEPLPPSQAITNRQNAETARKGKSLKSKIQNLKSKDLDNIVLKALRKDPERRYQAVEQLSEDLERYSKGLTVSARPDTFSYRATKFFNRNRAVTVLSLLMILALVAGICGTVWQAVRASRQQRIAEQRFDETRELAHNVVFKYHDAIANLNGSTEVRQMLVQDATKYLDGLSLEAGDDENLRNELALAYAKLADVQGKPFYANTGDTTGAAANYEKSIWLLENLESSQNFNIKSSAQEELIAIYHSQSSLDSRMFNFEQSISSQQKALHFAQSNLALEPNYLKRRLTFARSKLWLGDAFSEAGDFTDALNNYKETLILAESNYRDFPQNDEAATILGVCHDRIGRGLMLRGQKLARTDFPPEKISAIFDESKSHLEKTLELFGKAAAEKPDNQKFQRNYNVAETNYATALRNVGDFDASLKILQKVTEIRTLNIRTDGANVQLKTDYAEDLDKLALTLEAKNERSSASENIESALRIINELIKSDAANMEFRRTRFEIINDYGYLLFKRDDLKAALELYQDALKLESEEDSSDESAFKKFAVGTLKENIADCYAKITQNQRVSPSEKTRNLEKAKINYEQAFDLLNDSDVKREFTSRTPETLDYLERKIRDCRRNKL